MSDDVNKIKKTIPDEVGYESLKRIGRRYEQTGVIDKTERQRIEKAQDDIREVNDLIEARPEFANSKAITGSRNEAVATINRLSPKVRTRKELKRERAILESTRSIESDFSRERIHGQANEMSRDYGTQLKGLGLLNHSQKELEEQRSGYLNEIGALENKTTDLAANSLYDKEGRQDPDTMKQIQGHFRNKRALVGKVASVNTALRKQRQAGEDEESQDKRLFSAGRIADKVNFQQDVSKELKSGQGMGAMSMDKLKEQEITQAKGLAEALEKLKNSAGESEEAISGMKEQATEAADGLKKTQEAMRQGGGQGGFGGQLARSMIAAAPGMLNTAAAAMQESLINQPLSAMGTRAGFASFSNQMYQQRNAAINGDMTALSNASLAGIQSAEATGENLKENSNIVNATNLAAGGITTGLGVYGTSKAVGQQFNPLSTAVGGSQVSEIVNGVKTTIEGAAQVATSGTDLLTQTSANATKLAGVNANYNIHQQLNQVRGDFRQNFYDHAMGSRNAAISAGGAVGTSIMNQFASDDGSENGLLGRLQKERIAPTEYAKMVANGAQDQGSVFDTEQVITARKLEKSGAGSMETNMQRMSQLASAGTNNPQNALTSVLEASFSKGLDSSKALNMMVQNTTEMARSSVGASMLGMDVTGATSDRIASFVNTGNPNQEMATERAGTAADAMSKINSGIGSNFTDMLGISRIASATGMSTVGAMALKKLDDPTALAMQDQLEEYKKMTPNERGSDGGKALEKKLRGQLYDTGMGELVNKDGSVKADEAIKGFGARRESFFNSGAALNSIDPNVAGLKEYSSGKLTEEQMEQDLGKYHDLRTQVGKAGAFSDAPMTGREIQAGISGKSALTEEGKKEAEKKLAGVAPNQAMKDADTAATAGASDSANKARQAAKELGGAAEAMGKISKAMETLVTKLNDKTSEGFQNAAGDAARDFSLGAKNFVGAVSTFDGAATRMMSIPTSTGEAVAKALQPIGDWLSKAGTTLPGGDAKSGSKG